MTKYGGNQYKLMQTSWQKVTSIDSHDFDHENW
jgi:hypothetical protein